MQNAKCNFQLREAGLTDSVGMVRTAWDNNPALCPAFRVRRGRRAKCGAMTRYVGSRASGYPPDFVSFRRRAGALSAGAARRRRALGRSRPPSLWGALFGNATKSAGCANRTDIYQQGQTIYDGQQRRRARPYDMLETGAAVLNGPAPKQSLDRVRSSATNVAV